MTTATSRNGVITITGYFDDGVIVVTESSISAKRQHATHTDEQELNGVHAALLNTLGVTGVSHSELCVIIGNEEIEIDFMHLDFDDIKYDLESEGEARINVTGDSDDKIQRIKASLLANLKFDEIDVFQNPKNKTKTIYIYA